MVKRVFTICFVISFWLVGCGGSEEPTPQPTAISEENINNEVVTETAVTPTPAPTATNLPDPVAGLATVDTVQILTTNEAQPSQVSVRARGDHPNSCTTTDQVNIMQKEDEFVITITTLTTSGTPCTEALVPFDEIIDIDVSQLPAGSYTVTANGNQATFTIESDEPTEPETTEPESPANPATTDNGSISGLIFHDLCAITTLNEDETLAEASGCVISPNDEIVADGVQAVDEPGIAGVTVSLTEGSCLTLPDGVLATAVTDANGRYTFTDLPANTYCLKVDALAEANTAVLESGNWTYPTLQVNNNEVTLGQGETSDGIDFGWDYAFRPVPEVAEDCINSIQFVEDLNVPDDTVFAPGETIVKEWRLRNNGTCPWSTDYTLVAVDDIPLEGDTVISLTQPVVPGEPIDVAVTLVAPDVAGTYRSNWQIADANGNRFGINGFIEDAFYVRFVVDEAATESEAEEGETDSTSGSIGGVVWDDVCFITNSGNPSAGCTEISEGFYRADGTLNFSESVLISVTVSLAQGACPVDGGEIRNVLQTAVTDEDGLYRFDNLEEDTYCVFIDAFSDANVNLLIPGDWTYPALGTGRTGVILDAGEEILNIDFGWDFAE